MIGGGAGAFIGAVHRHALALDGQAQLIAGALASTPERALESGRAIGLPPDRTYPTWAAMLDAERRRPADDRLDAVVIVTPNDTHAAMAAAFASAGFAIICDKPLTTTLADASTLAAAVRAAGVAFAITYNYSGYPMVRQMRAMVAEGRLGPLRKVIAEYHQGWLATDLAATGQKQAAWRADPARAGAGALGDIATHAEHLARFVTGRSIEAIAAELRTVVPGRRVDDDLLIRVRFAQGLVGHLSVSQICVGEENGLTLRVYGSRGSLTWTQEHPNHLRFADDAGVATLTRGSSALAPAAANATRLPPGHPEGFIEAFANLYRGFFATLRGDPHADHPTLDDGVAGMQFIDAAQRSHANHGAWTTLTP